MFQSYWHKRRRREQQVVLISFLKTILIPCDLVSSYLLLLLWIIYYNYLLLLFIYFYLLLVIIYFYLLSFTTIITFTLHFIIFTTTIYHYLLLSVTTIYHSCFFELVIIYCNYLFSFPAIKMLLMLSWFSFFQSNHFPRSHFYIMWFSFLFYSTFLKSFYIAAKSFFYTTLAYSYNLRFSLWFNFVLLICWYVKSLSRTVFSNFWQLYFLPTAICFCKVIPSHYTRFLWH